MPPSYRVRKALLMPFQRVIDRYLQLHLNRNTSVASEGRYDGSITAKNDASRRTRV
jgi:hypothetical protein